MGHSEYILDCNRRIARFMGYFQHDTFIGDIGYEKRPCIFMSRSRKLKTMDWHGEKDAVAMRGSGVEDRELEYHTSMDALMEVIYRIESMGYMVEMASHQCQVYTDGHKEMLIDADFKDNFLDNAYDAVESFVGLYFDGKLKR